MAVSARSSSVFDGLDASMELSQGAMLHKYMNIVKDVRVSLRTERKLMSLCLKMASAQLVG